MSFSEALQSVFENFFVTDGRASRAEYWLFVLFIGAGALCLAVMDWVIFGASLGLLPFSLLFVLVMVAPLFSASFRRLHDRNMSGWWLLIVFAPGIGALALAVLFAFPGTQGRNRFGPDPRQRGSSALDAGLAPAE